jgi:hypothetical protein
MTDELDSRQRDEYGASKRAWSFTLLVHGAWLAVAIGSEVFNPSPVFLLVSSVGLPFTVWVLRDRADQHYRAAEALRRAHRLINAVGGSLSASERADLIVNAKSESGREPVPIGDYYASTRTEGLDRLAHLVQEEAFYTRDLAASAASTTWTGVGVIVVAVCVVMYGALQAAAGGALTGEPLSRVANASLAVAGLGLSGSLAELARGYSALAAAASRLYEKATAIADRGDAHLVELLPVLSAYDCALAGAAPIPTRVYLRHRDRLDAAWRAAHVPSASTAPAGVAEGNATTELGVRREGLSTAPE